MREYVQYSLKLLKGTKRHSHFESKIRKENGNRNEAFRITLDENIDMKTAILELKKENEDLKAYITYYNDVKKPLNADFQQCDFQFLIKNELSKRECSLSNVDRGFNLPKEQGKFIVDDPQKCAKCKAGIYKKFRKKHVARKQPQLKPDLPITQRKCPMYDGDYVSLAVCENCKRQTPRQYAVCQQTLKNR